MTLTIPLDGYYSAILALLAGRIGQGGAFLGEPLAVADEDGAARPYAALYPSPGNRRSMSAEIPRPKGRGARLTVSPVRAAWSMARSARMSASPSSPFDATVTS